MRLQRVLARITELRWKQVNFFGNCLSKHALTAPMSGVATVVVWRGNRGKEEVVLFICPLKLSLGHYHHRHAYTHAHRHTHAQFQAAPLQASVNLLLYLFIDICWSHISNLQVM